MRHLSPTPGTRFNKLVVIRQAERESLWVCLCDCGNEKTIQRSLLVTGRQKSCGCLNGPVRLHQRTHGQSKAPEYSVWVGMLSRCLKTTHKQYADYGGRGITVCERWRKDVRNFMADMGPRPSRVHQLDRIDNEGNYEPANCGWVSRVEQMNNRRTSNRTTLEGRPTGLRAMARYLAVPHSTFSAWIKRASRHDKGASLALMQREAWEGATV